MTDNVALDGTEKSIRCRVIVLGLTRPRIAKVMSLLLQPTDVSNNMDIEYLPCMATFDSYEDEHGKSIRYLTSVNYHGTTGANQAGSSLAPFFDQEAEFDKKDQEKKQTTQDATATNLGILGIVIGCGIEAEEDVQRIHAFFQALRGQDKEPLPMEVVQPNPEYATMKEETEAFKALSAEAKEEVTLQQTIGPGKMAKFVRNVSRNLIIKEIQNQKQVGNSAEPSANHGERDGKEDTNEANGPQSKPSEAIPAPGPREIDATKIRYACRKCRNILFGDDDMEDPPHVPAQHAFSARKVHHGGVGPGSCQSYFLSANGLDWMGDTSANEGRFQCPNTKCNTKLGTWHWAGAQCSCGTWVSPAIQVPFSKVDVVQPIHSGGSGLPSGAVVSIHIPQKLDQGLESSS